MFAQGLSKYQRDLLTMFSIQGGLRTFENYVYPERKIYITWRSFIKNTPTWMAHTLSRPYQLYEEL